MYQGIKLLFLALAFKISLSRNIDFLNSFNGIQIHVLWRLKFTLTVNFYYLWEIHQCWLSNARSLCPPNEVGDLLGYTCMIAWFSDVESHLLQLLIKYWSLQKQSNMIVVSSTCSATFPCLAKKEKKKPLHNICKLSILSISEGEKGVESWSLLL